MKPPDMPSNNHSSPLRGAPKPPAFRRFLSRAEMLTLIGMLLVISSVYLIWERRTAEATGVPGALFAASVTIQRSGRTPHIMLPLTVCALIAGASLLWTADAKSRLMVGLIQGACGLACVVVALSRFALLPGVLLGLTGGALLVYAAADRYNTAAPAAESNGAGP